MTFTSLHKDVTSLFNSHTSRNLAFREFARADAWPLLTATHNPEFNRFLLWGAPSEIGEMMPQVDKLLREHQLHRSVVLSAVDRDSGAWKGLAILKPFKDGIEMSLYIHPSAWNSGLVFMSGCAIIELLLKHFPDRPIYNRVMPDNRKMKRINLSYGFEKIDDTDEAHTSGERKPLEIYRLNRERWKLFNGVEGY